MRDPLRPTSPRPGRRRGQDPLPTPPPPQSPPSAAIGRIRSALLAVAFRTVVFSCLEPQDTTAITDLDSADTFLHQQRQDHAPFHGMRFPWDLGPWTLKYYGWVGITP